MEENVHTTKLYDIVHSEDLSHIFLVMDFMDTDLKMVIFNSKKAPLYQDRMILILYNLLCAMKFLHECNIIHRDIKPSNILVDE